MKLARNTMGSAVSTRGFGAVLGALVIGSLLAVLPASPAGADTASAINTGIVANGVAAAGGKLAATVYEGASGRDLSGDGDTDDHVLVLIDPVSGEAQSTQLVVDSGVRGLADGTLLLSREGVLHSYDVATSTLSSTGVAGYQVVTDLPDGRIVLSLYEGHGDGADLNGDEDQYDSILHLLTRGTNHLLNLGYAGYNVAVAGGDLLFASPESQHGVPLNDDDDLYDNVAISHDLATGVTTNLGLAAQGISPVITDGADATISVSEYLQGYDLNEDGDTYDDILHLFEGTSDTAMSVGISGGLPAVADARTIVVARYEQQDSLDLNGDGDEGDSVLHKVDAITGAATNLEVEGTTPQALGSGRVGFTTFERWSGTDHNSDGDTWDNIVGAVNAATAAAVHSTTASSNSSYPWQALSDGRIAFDGDEGAHGADLSGDGDTNDGVVQVFDPVSGATVSTEIPYQAGGPIRVVANHLLAFGTPEAGPGAGVDHNGDGDLWDSVPVLYDLVTGESSIVPIASRYGPRLVGDSIVLPATESDQSADLNDDGDQEDDVLHLIVFADGPDAPDADGDGLPDDRDPDEITKIVLALQRASFSSNGHPASFTSNLDRIEASIVAGDINGAVTELEALRRRVDGCNGSAKEKADKNDWIVRCTDQRTVRAAIDDLIANLRAG